MEIFNGDGRFKFKVNHVVYAQVYKQLSNVLVNVSNVRKKSRVAFIKRIGTVCCAGRKSTEKRNYIQECAIDIFRYSAKCIDIEERIGGQTEHKISSAVCRTLPI